MKQHHFKLNEIIQAVNEKGEKQYWCGKKECNIHDYGKPYGCWDCGGAMKPLLVWVEKIEKHAVYSIWENSFDTDLEKPVEINYSRYTHLKKSVDFKPKMNQKVWLKNFMKVDG